MLQLDFLYNPAIHHNVGGDRTINTGQKLFILKISNINTTVIMLRYYNVVILILTFKKWFISIIYIQLL